MYWSNFVIAPVPHVVASVPLVPGIMSQLMLCVLE